VIAALNHFPDQRGFVDVIAVGFAQSAKVLNADRQSLVFRSGIMRALRCWHSIGLEGREHLARFIWADQNGFITINFKFLTVDYGPTTLCVNPL